MKDQMFNRWCFQVRLQSLKHQIFFWFQISVLVFWSWSIVCRKFFSIFDRQPLTVWIDRVIDCKKTIECWSHRINQFDHARFDPNSRCCDGPKFNSLALWNQFQFERLLQLHHFLHKRFASHKTFRWENAKKNKKKKPYSFIISDFHVNTLSEANTSPHTQR